MIISYFIFFLISQLSLIVFLIYSFYLDLKYRLISNHLLKKFFIVGIIFSCLEAYYLNKNLFLIFILKIFIILLVFLLTFILFALKIIGGADGKIIILIFIILPINYLNLFLIFSFF